MDALTVLEIMFSSYPNGQVNEKLIANYLRHLSNVPVDVLQAACDKCVRECKFAPTIADIVERLPEKYSHPQGEYRGGTGRMLTAKEIDALPAPTRLYRDPNDVDGPEGRRWRLMQLARHGRGERGN